uniref:Uncharacterized protein n=1 Tax=Desulfovibrio sp. U5L TaxID=596152 RepID=I2Q2C5_9BACT
MARRAAFIKTLRDAPSLKDKVLLLSGPFEILPDGPEQKPDPKRLPAVSQAMTLLGYAAGALNPDEAAYLKSADAPLPAGFTILGQKPETAIVQAGGLPVGIVFFPVSPDPKTAVPPELATAVDAAAKSLRPKAKLVIGISGWGMGDEQAFLDSHPDALDLLLGSGPNAGTAGRTSASGKTLWSRAYIKGKTLNRLDILTLPGTPGFVWKSGTDFNADVVSLDDQYPADPAIQQMFQ